MEGQKHHYIPKFYLRQWAGLDRKVCEFSRPYRKVVAQRKHPDATGYSRGLYTMPNIPAHLQDVLENKFFSIADGQAAQTLQVMLKHNWVPTGEEKAAWTRFVLSLVYRTPEGIARSADMIRKYYAEDGTREFEAEYQKRKRPSDPETLRDYVKQHGPRMADTTIVEHLANIIQSKTVSDRIMAMQWHMGRIVRLRNPLLTSDRPIIMTNGISMPDAHMVMPLSPEHVLIMTNTAEEADKIKALSANGELAARMNDRMARQARKFVYGTDARQQRFVENRLGEKAACSPFE